MVLENKTLPMADRSTIQDQVCSTIRKAIFQGHFAPNEHLRQEELAHQLGVSRHPIREALKQLENEGLVISIPHKGSQVAGITLEDIEEIYTLRVMNEGLAASISFPLLSSGCLEEIRHYLEQMEKAINREDSEYYCLLNQKFHERLLMECNWRRLQSFLGILWNGFSPFAPSITGNKKQSMEDHYRIVELIERKEYDAAVQCLKEHIDWAGKLLINYMKEQPNFSHKSIPFPERE